MFKTLDEVQSERVVHSTGATFGRDVLETRIPVVVDFYADWCGPCRVVAPIVDQLAQEFDGRVRFVKLNVDEDEALASEYGVSSIPTMVFFKEGKEANRFIGAAPKEHYRQLINSYLLEGRESRRLDF